MQDRDSKSDSEKGNAIAYLPKEKKGDHKLDLTFPTRVKTWAVTTRLLVFWTA